MVWVVQAALGGSEHALGFHDEHVVEVPHQHGQQRQERQAVPKATEGAAHGEGQPVYQPVEARKESGYSEGSGQLIGNRLTVG